MGNLGRNVPKRGSPQLLAVHGFYHFDSQVDLAPSNQLVSWGCAIAASVEAAPAFFFASVALHLLIRESQARGIVASFASRFLGPSILSVFEISGLENR